VQVPTWALEARGRWTNTGATRPAFADAPGPGQESVWDFPRPPALRPDRRRVEVSAQSAPLAASTSSIRVCETASPPVFYVPPTDVAHERLRPVDADSWCEWKGRAEHLALVDGTDVPVAWRYPDPFPEFAAHAGWIAFYPGRVSCTVAGEIVRPQPGSYYGGWVTDDLTGPWKGDRGTEPW
jgi:uncharacterized protein (DUF427 family)